MTMKKCPNISLTRTGWNQTLQFVPEGSRDCEEDYHKFPEWHTSAVSEKDPPHFQDSLRIKCLSS
jgi:hypothetical protein